MRSFLNSSTETSLSIDMESCIIYLELFLGQHHEQVMIPDVIIKKE